MNHIFSRARRSHLKCQLRNQVIKENTQVGSPVTEQETEANNTTGQIMTITFETDCDILRIDRFVKLTLSKKHEKIPDYNNQLQQLLESQQNCTTVTQHRKCQREIDRLSTEIDQINHGEHLLKYIEESTPLLSRYSALPIGREVIDVMQTLPNRKELDHHDLHRISLVEGYLNIASKYAPIKYEKVIRQVDDIDNCPMCKLNLKDIYPDSDGSVTCPDCFYYRPASGMVSSTSKPSGSKIPKSDYKDRQNFHQTMLRYQGKIDPSVDLNKLFIQLDEYFLSIGFPPREDIKKRPYNIDQDVRDRRQLNVKKGTNLQLLIQGLKGTGNSTLYRDAWFIGERYWEWQLADLTEEENFIMNDYQQTQLVLLSTPISEKGRTSTISNQFRLYAHCLIRRIPCLPEDFKLPREDSMRSHRALFHKMCNNCGNPEIQDPFDDE